MGRRVRRLLRASAYPGALALRALVVWQGSQAAFSTEGFAQDPGPAPAQSSIFRPALLAPGAVGEQCFSLAASTDSRLFFADTNNPAGLGDYLWLRIEVGTGGSAQSCLGFHGALVMSGTLAGLSNLHTNYATGSTKATSGTKVNTVKAAQTYRVSYRLAANAPNSVSGGRVATTFVWETQAAFVEAEAGSA